MELSNQILFNVASKQEMNSVFIIEIETKDCFALSHDTSPSVSIEDVSLDVDLWSQHNQIGFKYPTTSKLLDRPYVSM